MVQTHATKWIGLFVAALCLSCGTNLTSPSGNTTIVPTPVTNATTAIGAVFSSGGSASLNAKSSLSHILFQFVVREAMAQSGGNTCSSLNNGPLHVDSSAQGATGVYGSSVDFVALDAQLDFCQNPSGNVNDNSDNQLFATFTIPSATITCGAQVFLISGGGVWRNRPDLGIYPQVYGTFTMTVAGAEPVSADCYMGLNASDEIVEGGCTNENSEVIQQDNGAICSVG